MDTENVAYGTVYRVQEDGRFHYAMDTENVAYGVVSPDVGDGHTMASNGNITDTENVAHGTVFPAFGTVYPERVDESFPNIMDTENVVYGIMTMSMGDSVTTANYENDVHVENAAHGRVCAATGNGITQVSYENVMGPGNSVPGTKCLTPAKVQEVNSALPVNQHAEDDEASSMADTQDTVGPPSSRLRVKQPDAGTNHLKEFADARKPKSAPPKPKPRPARNLAKMQNGAGNNSPGYLEIIAPRSNNGEVLGNLECKDKPIEDEAASSITNTWDTCDLPSSRLRMKQRDVGTDRRRELANTSQPKTAAPKPRPGRKPSKMQLGGENPGPGYLEILPPRSNHSDVLAVLHCKDKPNAKEIPSEGVSYLSLL